MRLFAYSFIACLAVCSSSAADKLTIQVFDENVEQYEKAQTKLVRDFVRDGKSPTSDDLVSLKIYEQQLLSFVQLDASLRSRLPELSFSKIRNYRSREELIGKLFVERLRSVGIDPFDDPTASLNFKVRR